MNDNATREKPRPPEPKHAGRQEVWPTLWHKDQLPFPWGAAKRLRRRPSKPAVNDDVPPPEDTPA